MEIKELMQFTDFENKRINKAIIKNYSRREKILLRVVKIMEELGELCDEVISFNNGQRKNKQKKFRKEKLSEEFVDVVLTVFLLGESLDIDIEKELEKKIKRIKARKY